MTPQHLTPDTPPPRRRPGRPRLPEPTTMRRYMLSDADHARLDRIARRDAGPSGVVNHAATVRRLIREESERMGGDTNEGGRRP